ncbi:PH domain-containing protein [Herbidospora mongoliensis]|uniref:PH domain-containing protein n=1 Tax=Herbidospora mongoliensis TaxID=688067 RepID=UPI000A6C6A63|nr:PH domain-containing protein [Herbidospora mongoliensis]
MSVSFQEPVPEAVRLSPRLLLIDPIRVLPSLLIPLAGVLVAGGFSPRSFIWAAFGVAGSVLYAVVRWATFSYTITGGRLELSRAFIGRSTRVIPLERIRGVDVTTPFLHRLLGLAVLKLDTGAGGDKQEGELDGITVEEAERLRAVLLARHGVATQEEREQPVAAPHDHVFLRAPKAWLRYGPLSGAFLFTPFALVAGVVGLAFQWGGELGLDEDDAVAVGSWLWGHPLLLIGGAVALVVLMPFLGAAMYAVFNWNFVLFGRGDHLVAERGLVNRRVVSLERRRIRGYEIAESPLERQAGVARLWAVVTGLGDSETRGQLLPVAPRAAVDDIAAEAVGPFSEALRPHPPAARRRRLFRAIAPWAVSALVLYVLGHTIIGVIATVLAVAGIALGLDRYRSLGHTYDGTRLSVRSGSLRRAQAVVERRAVVGWTIRQTWFQRRAGLVTVIAGVGAGSGGYKAIDAGETQAAAFAAEVTPDWMAPFLKR